jgi:hypothetical protein
MIYQVVDIEFEEIQAAIYDIALFASGYESRSTYIPRQLNRNLIEHSRILGFDRLVHEKQRIKNDQFFESTWAPVDGKIDADDNEAVIRILNETKKPSRQALKIFVDYSSMSRLWYGGILNWAEFVSEYEEVIVDFAYAIGDHREEMTPMVINEILCMPGCEGVPLPVSPTLGVFGLGFEGTAALCVLDQLEPFKIYSFWAEPAAFDNYPEIVRKQNEELLALSDKAIKLPIHSVEQSFAKLAELISHDLDNSDVVLIPMGAKPHVLTSILLAMKFPHIACLRVSASASKSKDVRGAGVPICTRVHFRNVPSPN